MKKLLVLAISLAGFAGAKAQEGSEKTWLLQGNIMYKSTGSNSNEFELNPKVGYQINTNWTLGLDLGIGSKKVPVLLTSSTTSTYKVGVFGRYAWTLSPIFRTYLEGNVGFGSSKISGISTRTNFFDIGVAPFIGINVKNNFVLNFGFGGIGYNSSKLSTSGSTSSNTFKFNFGQSWTVGVSKNFGGKK